MNRIDRIPETIIWVDDEQEMIDPFLPAFEDAGIKVKYLTSPADVVKVVESEDFDWLISDFTMPGMTGNELIEKLLENKRCPRTVILLSSLFPLGFNDKAFAKSVEDKLDCIVTGDKVPTIQELLGRFKELRS